MATEPAVRAPYELVAQDPRGSAIRDQVRGYWALTKPDVNFLIAVTVLAGFCLAHPDADKPFPLARLIHALVGTLLVAGGAGALNQLIEWRFDARMRRTARRPLASGQITTLGAGVFGVFLCATGCVDLGWGVNWLTAALAGLTLISYLFVYTPWKRRNLFCTPVGALAGAFPPLIGWAAATGRLNAGAWILYGLIFLWQFPHFMAIAWIYRHDYERAGYKILPQGQQRERFVAWMSVLPTLLLIPLTAMPVLLRSAGPLYLTGAWLLTVGFLTMAAHLVRHKSNAIARRVLLASIVYLPSVLFLLLMDRR